MSALFNMNANLTSDSVALFFEPLQGSAISAALVEDLLAFANANSARPLLFTAFGGEFLLDDCYLFSDDTDGIELWDTPIPNRKRELLDALQRGDISIVSFDVPLPTASQRSEWSLSFSVSAARGKLYYGVLSDDRTKESLLLQRYSLGNRFFDLRYGFAYRMPLGEEPRSYASGIPRTTLADYRKWLAMRSSGVKAPLTPDACWRRDLEGPRRHLTGLFRDAYPENLLTDAHIRRAELESAGIGALRKIEGDRWYWQIDDASLPAARDYLFQRGCLVRQAYT